MSSPLSLKDSEQTLRLDIYCVADTDLILEAVDSANSSSVWDGLFKIETAAVNEALRTIREAGIESLLGPRNLCP